MKTGESKSFYDQVREAVHYKWDPIGVAAYSDSMGEYDGYILGLCELLEKAVNSQKVFEYLWTMETDSMGLEGDRQVTEEFSFWLYKHLGKGGRIK